MKIFEGLINMGVLFIALNVMTETDPEVTGGQLIFLMLAGAASDIFYVLRFWKKGWYPKLKYIVSAVIKTSGATVLFFATHDYSVYYLLMAIVVMYFFIFPFGSALKMIKNRKPRNIIAFILVLAFFSYLSYVTITTEEDGFVLGISMMSIFSMASSLVRVMATSFSGIKINILRKIIRKTYAVEILFGLLLLIVSFSMVFYRLEPSFNGYGDALWYSFALFTTIGFGDRVATTVVGRLLSVILGSYGIVVVALITSIVVNFYNEVKTDGDDEEEIEYDDEGNEIVKIDEKLQEKLEKDIEKKLVNKDTGEDEMPF